MRSLSVITLFQATGVAIFIALFGREVGRSLAALRRVGLVSAIAGIVLVAVHYSLEAARMAGALSGVLDVSLQQLVLDSPTSTALGARPPALC